MKPNHLHNVPVSPHGDVLTKEYWFKNKSVINKCGEYLLDIMKEFTRFPIVNKSNGTPQEDMLEMCEERVFSLQRKFGEIPFAVALSVYYSRCIAIFDPDTELVSEGITKGVDDKEFNVFTFTVVNIYSSLSDEVVNTVEKLAYIATKYDKSNKPKSVADLNKRMGITVDDIIRR